MTDPKTQYESMVEIGDIYKMMNTLTENYVTVIKIEGRVIMYCACDKDGVITQNAGVFGMLNEHFLDSFKIVKNHDAPTWQTMNDLAKEIRDDNLKQKIPLTNEIWINSKTNELVHITSVSGGSNELMFSDGFNLFISSIDKFLKAHKFIDGIESKKDLEIFELKQLLKQSQELNTVYEKEIKKLKAVNE